MPLLFSSWVYFKSFLVRSVTLANQYPPHIIIAVVYIAIYIFSIDGIEDSLVLKLFLAVTNQQGCFFAQAFENWIVWICSNDWICSITNNVNCMRVFPLMNENLRQGYWCIS